MTVSSMTRTEASARRAAPGSIFSRMYGVWRQRRALERLDANALSDIGVTETEARAEARRPFWDAPNGWQR